MASEIAERCATWAIRRFEINEGISEGEIRRRDVGEYVEFLCAATDGRTYGIRYRKEDWR